MNQVTFTRPVKRDGNSRVIRVPPDFVKEGLVDLEQDYQVTLEEIEEERDE